MLREKFGTRFGAPYSEDELQDDEIPIYFNDLLATTQDKLLKLTVTRGIIDRFPQAIRLRSITRLEFRHIAIYESVLPLLSAALNAIVFFQCYICKDDDDDGAFYNKSEMRIPNSSLDILKLSAEEEYAPLLLSLLLL